MSMAAGSVLLAATVRSQTPPAFDLVIAGGRIVDGTGAPWFRGDVGIKRGPDRRRGRPLRRRRRRAASTPATTWWRPGFIDMLGQSEMTLLADNRAESKIRQGITSEITGEGGSAAPVTEATLKDQRAWLDTYKIKVDWTDFRGYFDALRRARPAINLGSFVGAAQVRQVVLGSERRRNRRRSSSSAWKRWWRRRCSRARSASRRRSSTRPGPTRARRSSSPSPGSPRATAGSTPRTSATRPSHEMEALEEAITIGREAKIPVEIWHLKVAGRLNWGHMKDVVARIERARAEGLDVTADMYPYVASGNGLDATVPAMGAGRRRGRDDPALPRPRAARAHPEGDPRGTRRRVGRLEGTPAGGHPDRVRARPVAARSGRASGSRRWRRRWGSRRRRRSSTSWRRTARTSSWPASR